MHFCGLLIFFQTQLFLKILQGLPSECQTVWILIRLNVGKELRNVFTHMGYVQKSHKLAQK